MQEADLYLSDRVPYHSSHLNDHRENPRYSFTVTSQWRHNERDGVSNQRRLDCLLNRLFRRRSNKNQSSASLAFVGWPLDSPHKGPVTRKKFPFDDVIMEQVIYLFRLLLKHLVTIWGTFISRDNAKFLIHAYATYKWAKPCDQFCANHSLNSW